MVICIAFRGGALVAKLYWVLSCFGSCCLDQCIGCFGWYLALGVALVVELGAKLGHLLHWVVSCFGC